MSPASNRVRGHGRPRRNRNPGVGLTRSVAIGAAGSDACGGTDSIPVDAASFIRRSSKPAAGSRFGPAGGRSGGGGGHGPPPGGGRRPPRRGQAGPGGGAP